MAEHRDVVLAVTGFHRLFGDVTALDGLDLTLHAGCWHGLIGPNGAGKTTLMSAIAGLSATDRGSIELLGKPVDRPGPDGLGWVPQEIALYPRMTARENLTLFARFHGVRGRHLADRVAWALGWTGLEMRADRFVEGFSGGMKRRLNIACGILHRPRVVLLDEPTVGVDPQARERIFSMLETLRDDGAALLQSSHELGDIESRCDVVTVIDHGRAIAAGSVDDIVRRTVGLRATLRLDIEDLHDAIPGLERDGGSGRWFARLTDVAAELPPLLAVIRDRDARVVGMDLQRPGLPEAFAELTGRELRE